MATTLAGRPLVEASWALLKRDPSIVALLVIGSLASSVAFALVALPLYAAFGLPADGSGSASWVSVVVYAPAVFGSTLVSIFFLGAVVAAAMQRADGGDPTFGSALAAAWERRAQLVAWAAVTTVVGIALRQLERFGLAGSIVRLLAGVSWAVATCFAIPVIMAEGTMPRETIRRSGTLLTTKFGTNVRATARLGVIYILLWLGIVAVGMTGMYTFIDGVRRDSAIATGSGITMMLAAIVGGFVAMACWQATAVYLRTVLYRYATGRPTPGVGQWVLPPLLGGPDPATATASPTWTFPGYDAAAPAFAAAAPAYAAPAPVAPSAPSTMAAPTPDVLRSWPAPGTFTPPPPRTPAPPAAATGADVLPSVAAPPPAAPALVQAPTQAPVPGPGAVFLPQ